MTIEHEEFLLKTYPSLFPEKRIREEDITQSGLAWGFECGDGWFSLLNELFEKMVATGYNP